MQTDKSKTTYGITDIGLHRNKNEDSFWINSTNNLFIVVDGMGGHNAGEIASKMAIDLLSKDLNDNALKETSFTSKEIEDLFKNALVRISEIIYNKGKENPEYSGMGCTVAIALIYENWLYSCHVGDARIYICNAGIIQQVGFDHSHVADLVKNEKLTREEARLSPLKNQITQALGIPHKITPEFHKTKLMNNDIVLLCSDGLWDMLPDQEIQRILLSGNNAKTISEELIRNANDEGGNDNITVIVSINK